MADAKIITYGEPFSATTDVIPDGVDPALLVEDSAGLDFLELDTQNERVTIAGGGAKTMVGSTTAPLVPLHVVGIGATTGMAAGTGAATPVLYLDAGNAGSANNRCTLLMNADGSSGSQLDMYQADNRKLLITAEETTQNIKFDDLLIFGDLSAGEAMRITGDRRITTGGQDTPLGVSAGSLHVYTGTASLETASTGADDFIIEGSSHTGMTILSASNNQLSSIFFACDDANGSGWVRYNHNATPANGSMAVKSNGFTFFETGGENERMRIDASGLVGIGATVPVHKLHVQDGDAAIVTNSADAAAKSLVFTKSRNATDGSHTIVEDDDVLGAVEFKGSDGNSFAYGAAIKAMVAGTPGDGDMPTDLNFYTAADGAEALVLNAHLTTAGVFGVRKLSGIAGVQSDVHIQGAAAGGDVMINNGNGRDVKIYNGSGGAQYAHFDAADQRLGIKTTNPAHALDVVGTAGLSTGTAWSDTSDSRIKTDVQNIENALEKINQLRPVSFRYSDDYLSVHQEIDGSRRYNSFVAQEYGQVFPDAVSTRGNLERVVTPESDGVEEVRETLLKDVQQYTPHDLTMYLVKSVQELTARIEELENGN